MVNLTSSSPRFFWCPSLHAFPPILISMSAVHFFPDGFSSPDHLSAGLPLGRSAISSASGLMSLPVTSNFDFLVLHRLIFLLVAGTGVTVTFVGFATGVLQRVRRA